MKTNPKPILLGLLAVINCGICSYQCDNWYNLQLEILLVTSKVSGELIFFGLVPTSEASVVLDGFTLGCSKTLIGNTEFTCSTTKNTCGHCAGCSYGVIANRHSVVCVAKRMKKTQHLKLCTSRVAQCYFLNVRAHNTVLNHHSVHVIDASTFRFLLKVAVKGRH